jgi:hypothetical protein
MKLMVETHRKKHYISNVLPSISIHAFHIASKMYKLFMFSSNPLSVYNFRPAQPLIIEHVISKDTISKPGIKCKLLSIQEKLDVIITVDAT